MKICCSNILFFYILAKGATMEHDRNYSVIEVLLLCCILEQTYNSSYITHELYTFLVQGCFLYGSYHTAFPYS